MKIIFTAARYNKINKSDSIVVLTVLKNHFLNSTLRDQSNTGDSILNNNRLIVFALNICNEIIQNSIGFGISNFDQDIDTL